MSDCEKLLTSSSSSGHGTLSGQVSFPKGPRTKALNKDEGQRTKLPNSLFFWLNSQRWNLLKGGTGGRFLGKIRKKQKRKFAVYKQDETFRPTFNFFFPAIEKILSLGTVCMFYTIQIFLNFYKCRKNTKKWQRIFFSLSSKTTTRLAVKYI